MRSDAQSGSARMIEGEATLVFVARTAAAQPPRGVDAAAGLALLLATWAGTVTVLGAEPLAGALLYPALLLLAYAALARRTRARERLLARAPLSWFVRWCARRPRARLWSWLGD